jgi:hypothetical protein
MMATTSSLCGRRTRLTAALFVGVLLAATACTGGRNRSGPSPAPSAPVLTSQRVAAFTTALSSGVDQDVCGVVLVPVGRSLDPGAAAQLKAAGPVMFDVGSFRPVDASHAIVSGRFSHPPAGQSATWVFDLAWVNDRWMITDTEATR